MTMLHSTSQLIERKLRNVIPTTWSLTVEPNGFLIIPTFINLGSEKPQHRLTDEAWRIAKLVSFKNFVSIEKTKEGGRLIYSKDDSDQWFQIQLDLA
jgi:hypothetical protein